MKNRLYLSQVDDMFDPERDLAFGPWCFIGTENIYPVWETLEFVDPFMGHEKLAEAEHLSLRLTNRLVPKWAERLNEQHGIQRSNDFWRLPLIMWLLVSVQALWARYRHAEVFIQRYGKTNLCVDLADEKPPVHCRDFIDFQHHLRRNPQFEEWICSQVIRELAPNNWTLNTLSATAPDNTPRPISNERKNLIGSFIRSVYGRLPFDSVTGVKFAKIPFSIFLALLPAKGHGKNHYSFDDDAIFEEFPPRFLNLLDNFLKATLPSDYDAEFDTIYAKAMSAKTRPGKLFVGNFMPTTEQGRMELANAVDKGEKLIASQHGSGYGTQELISWGTALEYPYHALLTWGWTKQSNLPGRFIPLPSPLLGKFRDKHREKNAQLVMPGTKIDFRGLRLLGPRPQHWLEYRKAKITFIQHLDQAPRDQLAYYPYKRGNMDLEDETYLQRFIHNLNIAKGDLVTDMLDCRLLVLDHVGTTLNIAMAANVPLVCYWDPEGSTHTKQAQPYFDSLKKCGVVHENPQSAAVHINAHWDDIAGWWHSETVQAARKEWCNQYAYSKRFWWIDWIKALTRLQRT